MKTLLSLCRPAALALALTALVGCSTTPRQEAQWIDPALGTQSRFLQGEKILVACDAYDAAIRLVCQNALVREVAASGATPVTLPPGAAFMTDRELDGQLVSSAAGLGAKAILVMALTPVASSAGSGLSIGIGGFSVGRGGGGGIGLSAPVGGSRVDTGLSANGRVTDVRNGRLVWTSSFMGSSSEGLEAQSASLSRALLDAARKSGLF